MKANLFGFVVFMLAGLGAAGQKPGSAANPFVLNPSVGTVAWGYYWSEAKPVLSVHSGDYVRVRTLITSNPERLEAAGVPADQVEKELRDVQAVKERGPGGHVLTGPIYVEEAEPGDVLEVHYDSIQLAIPYGYNAIGQAGFLSDEIFDRKTRIIQMDRSKMVGHFADGIEIPLHPFFGSAGWRRLRRWGNGTALRRGSMRGIWTIKTSWRVRRCSFRCL
ncbi:acetamidase/formamidase family protein [Puia sp. P3]|uniref:acetamidase/formamidase family protein n=1 Tax=Puia sp. P3 TaxID=3423952 RepID=UPI003D67F464